MEKWKSDFYNNYASYAKREYKDNYYEGYIPYGKHIINLAFPKEKNIRILDLACGIGGFLKVIKDSGYTDITGVDTSEEEINFAHNNGLTSLIRDDIFNYMATCESEQFDFVLALDIIEHLESEEILLFMNQVNRILKPKGKIIIHTPNAEGIFGSKVRYADFTHAIAFTQNSITQVCTYAGFSSVKCYEDKPVLYSLTGLIRRIIWDVFTLFFRLLHGAETGSFNVILSQNFLIIAQK